MQTLPRLGALLALLTLAACSREPSGVQGSASSGPLLPNYTDRGIVVLEGRSDRPNFWDFDQVPFGEQPLHVFRLKNLDPEPVTIRDMQPSCGCMQPTLRLVGSDVYVRGLLGANGPKITLAPGAEAELEIRMDTTAVERINIDKLAWVRVTCDSKTTPFLAYEVHIIVRRDFHCTPASLDLGEIPEGYAQRKRGDVITEVRGCQARILGIESVEGPFSATVDETTIATETVWILVVEANADQALGPVRGKVLLQTTGTDGTGTGPPFGIPIRGQVVPRIVLRPGILRFQKGKDTAEAVLECLVPGEKVELRGVHWNDVSATRIAVEWSAKDRDEQGRASKWTLRFTAEDALPKEGFARSATIELDDPKMPELVLPVAGEAR